MTKVCIAAQWKWSLFKAKTSLCKLGKDRQVYIYTRQKKNLMTVAQHQPSEKLQSLFSLWCRFSRTLSPEEKTTLLTPPQKKRIKQANQQELYNNPHK